MKNKSLAYPYVGWMALFVIFPLILVVIYAFPSRTGGFTLENFATMKAYIPVFTRSFFLALISTVICLLIGYPVAYLLSR